MFVGNNLPFGADTDCRQPRMVVEAREQAQN